MRRTARASQGGFCYLVLNRGNCRRGAFPKDGDYAAFLRTLTHTGDAVHMRVAGYCLMSNHFHFGTVAVWRQRFGKVDATINDRPRPPLPSRAVRLKGMRSVPVFLLVEIVGEGVVPGSTPPLFGK
jgi:hypothetical protein